MTELLLIDNAEALGALVQHLRGCASVGIDTEFVRTDTFFPRLGLIQVSDGAGTWLIDPLAMGREDMEHFGILLADENVLKVLHSCSEDLEVLEQATGQLPRPVFDTQVAAAFVGLGFSLGYQALVSELTGVQLAKHETRSDWMLRPLSAAQRVYAAEDVEHLATLHARLSGRLAALERLEWFGEDMTKLIDKAAVVAADEDYYQRIKGAWKLDRRQLAVLRALAAWRERRARQTDRPRARIVSDKELFAIAAHDIRSSSDWSRLSDNRAREIRPRVIREYGAKLIEIVTEYANTQLESHPPRLPKPVPRQYGGIMKSCKQLVLTRARDLALAPEMLVRRADLESLVRNHWQGCSQLPPTLAQGWRRTVIGEDLLAHVETKGAQI